MCRKKLLLNTVKIKGSMDVNETDLSYTKERCLLSSAHQSFCQRKSSITLKSKQSPLLPRIVYIFFCIVRLSIK
jgi:hypothetical protein